MILWFIFLAFVLCFRLSRKVCPLFYFLKAISHSCKDKIWGSLVLIWRKVSFYLLKKETFLLGSSCPRMPFVSGHFFFFFFKSYGFPLIKCLASGQGNLLPGWFSSPFLLCCPTGFFATCSLLWQMSSENPHLWLHFPCSPASSHSSCFWLMQYLELVPRPELALSVRVSAP